MAGELTGKITKIRCNDGEEFGLPKHEVTPFGTNSFMVSQPGDLPWFLIVPSRCVDRIWMEVSSGNDEAITESET